MGAEKNREWQSCDKNVFWGEIAPTDHVIQIYENDESFLDLLTGFVCSGFKAHECVIVIATPSHLAALTTRINQQGYSAEALTINEQYIPLNAEDVLSAFMVNGWPDETLFRQTISAVIGKAHSRGRRVRAFGEMVALLWAQGLNGATVQLENLWNRFCAVQSFPLFCAYPKSGFTEDIGDSIAGLCSCHSKVVSGSHSSKTEIHFKTIPDSGVQSIGK
jgi:hypothetical protein